MGLFRISTSASCVHSARSRQNSDIPRTNSGNQIAVADHEINSYGLKAYVLDGKRFTLENENDIGLVLESDELPAHHPRVLAQQASRQGSVGDEQELQRLGGVFRDLRKTREATSQEIESRWDEDKFAASQRYDGHA